MMDLGSQKVIMGHSWLQKHNPDIDWTTGEVKMSCCSDSCCSGCCRDKICMEQKLRKIKTQRLSCCSKGGPPALASEEDDENEVPLEFEDSDWIFITTLHGIPEEVRATSTISQRLAEAFKWNTNAAHPPAVHLTPAEGILDHLREFSNIFSRESFNVLPNPKPWDHAIELVLGEKHSGCKVYPLSPLEKKELDAFLQENLKSGRIWLSKSPMCHVEFRFIPAPFPDLPSHSRPVHHIPSCSFPSSPLRSLLRPLRQHSCPSLPFPASPFLSVILRFSPYPVSIHSSPFLSALCFCPPFSVSIRTPFLSLRSPFLPSSQLDKRFIEYYY